MFIQSDGIKLNARFELPEDGREKYPVCIIIHGITGNLEERHLTALSEMMNRIGIATLRVDMYGHGKSEGLFEKHTLYRWLTNAMDVINYARSLQEVTDIYLCGHSQGGLLAILLAAMEKDVIKALLPLSPAVMIPDGARSGDLLGYHFDPENLPPYLLSWDKQRISTDYVRIAQTIDVDKAIAAYPGKVLIVHGEDDATVPVKYAEETAAKYRDGRFVPVPGDTHCFDNHLEEMVKAVEDFLVNEVLNY